MSKKKSAKTTIHDIAYELGLNASTVSRALNDNLAVSKKTRELVKAKALEMNYQPNYIAAALRRGRSNTLGVIIPAIDRSFFGRVIRGIEEEADEAGFRVIVCQSFDSSAREREMVDTLRGLQVDGLLISVAKDTDDNLDLYQKLISSGFPIQFFDNVPSSLEVVPAVIIDDRRGGYAATKHLIDQGYRRIAHMRGPQHLHIYRNRYLGYLDAMQEAGLDVREDYVLEIISHFDSGEEAFEELWNCTPRPEAIFSASDFSAVSSMKAAQRLGLRVPEDIAFMGFSNEPFNELVSPTLSSVDQQPISMGQIAAKRAIKAITNKAEDELPNDRLVLMPEVVVRESSGAK